MVLDDRVKSKVATYLNVQQRWEELALELGFSDQNPTVFGINNRRRADQMELKVRDLLREWEMQMPSEATLENLIAALESKGIDELAQELQKMTTPSVKKSSVNRSSVNSSDPLNRKIENVELSKLAKELRTGWNKFAADYLKLEPTVIEAAKQKLLPDMDPYNPALHVLRYWQNATTPTARKLVDLLEAAKDDGYITAAAFDIFKPDETDKSLDAVDRIQQGVKSGGINIETPGESGQPTPKQKCVDNNHALPNNEHSAIIATEITQEMIDCVTANEAASWVKLARKIFKQKELSEIETIIATIKAAHQGDIQEQCHAMLTKWVTESTEATPAKLVDCLREIEKDVTAKKIIRMAS